MRNKKSRWAAVLGRKITAVKTERDPRLPVHQVLQRQICRVVAVRTHQGIRSIGFYVCKHRIEGNAFPRCAELRPSRNAVYISREGLGGQGAKCLTIPSPQDVGAIVD